MKTTWIIVIAFCTFMFGFALGTGIGMQKGQYMLFEGMGIALDDANINLTIDINETSMIDRVTENFMPLINETMRDFANSEKKEKELGE